MVLRRCGLLVVFLSATPLLALDPTKRVTQYVLHSLAREDGLPQMSVQSIVQTRDGYVWLGTEEGVARYSGARIVSFGNWNTPEMAGNDAQTMFEDRDGTLWIGSHGHGITQFREGRFRRVAPQLANRYVWSIAQDAKGGMWIATDAGVSHLAGGRVERFTAKEGLANDMVYAVLAARDGSIWAGSRGGLSVIRDGSVHTYGAGDGLPGQSVRTLYEAPDGVLWIGTIGGGLARLVDGKITAVPGLPNPDVFAIRQDRDGNVWIGTGGGGLARLRDGRIDVLASDAGLPNDTVLALLEDAEGGLWVGTDGGGATRLKDSKFVTFARSDGLSHDVVMSVYEDAAGAMWLGTLGGGVNRLSAGTVRAYTVRDGLSNDQVFAVAGDRRGAIWIGTVDGLNRLEGDRFTVYRKKDGLASSAVSAIYEDRDGALWLGTPEGVTRLRDGRFTTFTPRDGLVESFVLAILQDRHGTMWLGTDGGLSRFDGRTFTTLGPKDGLADDLVMSLHEDDDGVLWVGTRKGLSRMANGRLVTLTRKDGLPDDLILATIDDHHGSLWVSCNDGVFRLSKKELAAFAAGRVRRVSAAQFGIADGLRTSECNGGVQPSAWQARNGTIWFPTVKGVALIDPAHIRTNRLPPRVVIESAVVDEHPIAAAGPLHLAAGTHRLEVQYAGLSYSAPERVRFRYRLQGFDRGWIDADTRRSAVYTNLSPGTYRFEVIAANNDGVWSAAPAALDVEQVPFFRQTALFVVLWVLGGAALAAYLFVSYMKRIRAEFAGKLAERARIARELHDTLAQQLVGAKLQLSLAAESLPADADGARKRIESGAGIIRDSLVEIRRVLAELRPPALAENGLPAALEDVAARAADIGELRPQVIVKGAPRPLDPPVENDLLRIGQEAIVNAVRHSHARRVDVELTYLPDRVQLRVSDDGIGAVEPNGPSDTERHYGIAGMRERAARINARLTINTAASKGTEVAVEVNG